MSWTAIGGDGSVLGGLFDDPGAEAFRRVVDAGHHDLRFLVGVQLGEFLAECGPDAQARFQDRRRKRCPTPIWLTGGF